MVKQTKSSSEGGGNVALQLRSLEIGLKVHDNFLRRSEQRLLEQARREARYEKKRDVSNSLVRLLLGSSFVAMLPSKRMVSWANGAGQRRAERRKAKLAERGVQGYGRSRVYGGW